MVIEKKLQKAIKSKNINIIDSVFEEIYNEYFNLVTYIISKNVKNRNDVEELTDDVFMNFYTSCNKQDINNIKYYLVQTAKNISLNFLRKKNVQFEYNEDYINNYVTNDEKTLYDDIMLLLEKHLSSYEINIILLHNVDCYSLKEIAKKYNKPYNSVLSTYNRAIRKFKKEVKNEY